MKFNWSWCEYCEAAMIICPQCGNNSCNGTYGCELCKQVYDYQDKCYTNDEYPKSKDELEKYNNK
jgi:hypothetical protein